MQMRKVILGLGLVFSPCGAQAGHLSWTCEFIFGVMNRNTEMAAPVQSDIVVKPERLQLRFLVTGDKAFMLGNNGSNPVMVFVPETGGGGVQFVEITGADTVNVTAIDKDGNAVHSRHSMARSYRLIPSQYFGQCRRDAGG